jgi:predicted metal-binding membrane protein
VASDSLSFRRFFGVSVLLFASGTVATIVWCASMSAMGTMPMPGGWSMSMMWMRMPGRGWLGTAASFDAMWAAMMIAMMLPSLSPMLWRCRQAIGKTGEQLPDRLTVLIAAGYFFAWTAAGIAVFALGATLASLAVRWPSAAHAAPLAGGVVVMIAGAIQFTRWKACHLACCRDLLLCGGSAPTDDRSAWRHGLRFGLHCAYCCAGLMSILLVVGVMDLRAMILVTAAITAERLTPQGVRVARAIGVVTVACDVLLLLRASGLG